METQGPRVAPGFKCLDFNSLLLNLCLLSPFYVSSWVPLILGAGFCQVSAYQCLGWYESESIILGRQRGSSFFMFCSCSLTLLGGQEILPWVLLWASFHPAIIYGDKAKGGFIAQLCPTLCDPMDCSLSSSSVYGIFQAIVLEWLATKM